MTRKPPPFARYVLLIQDIWDNTPPEEPKGARRIPWEQEQSDIVSEMYLSGKKDCEIAQVVQRSIWAVKNQISALGLPARLADMGYKSRAEILSKV